MDILINRRITKSVSGFTVGLGFRLKVEVFKWFGFKLWYVLFLELVSQLDTIGEGFRESEWIKGEFD